MHRHSLQASQPAVQYELVTKKTVGLSPHLYFIRGIVCNLCSSLGCGVIRGLMGNNGTFKTGRGLII